MLLENRNEMIRQQIAKLEDRQAYLASVDVSLLPAHIILIQDEFNVVGEMIEALTALIDNPKSLRPV